jgi:hypothetical protein
MAAKWKLSPSSPYTPYSSRGEYAPTIGGGTFPSLAVIPHLCCTPGQYDASRERKRGPEMTVELMMGGSCMHTCWAMSVLLPRATAPNEYYPAERTITTSAPMTGGRDDAAAKTYVVGGRLLRRSMA